MFSVYRVLDIDFQKGRKNFFFFLALVLKSELTRKKKTSLDPLHLERLWENLFRAFFNYAHKRESRLNFQLSCNRRIEEKIAKGA